MTILHSRDHLATRKQHYDDTEKEALAITSALETARQDVRTKQQAIMAAERAIEDEQSNHAQALVDAALSKSAPPDMRAHEMRLRLAALEDELGAARQAVNLLEERERKITLTQRLAKTGLDDSLAQTVQSSPELKTLLEGVAALEQELSRSYAAIQVLSAAVPNSASLDRMTLRPKMGGQHPLWRDFLAQQDQSLATEWRQALQALRTDPHASLPGSTTPVASKPKRVLSFSR